MNRLSSITDWFGKTIQFGYDKDDQLTSVTYPNNDSAAYTFNNAQQLTQIQDKKNSTVEGTATYVPNKDGLFSSVTDLISGKTDSYTYDQFNRIRTDAVTSGATTTYTPDNAGDITGVAVSGGGPTTTNTYDSGGTDELATQKVVTGSTTNFNWTFSYNAEGDQTSASDSVSNSLNSYTYDQANRLTSWTQNSNPTNYFAYDGNGQLLTQTVGTGGSAVVSHLNWDYSTPQPALNEITQVSGGTTSYEYFVNGPGIRGGTEPYEQIGFSGTVSFLLSDHLGSVRALMSTSGDPQNTSYSAYGMQSNSSGSATTPLQYAGQFTVTAGNPSLQYMGARWYNAQTMDWMSRDPFGATTNQPYLYTRDDPANLTDPLGLFPPSLSDIGSAISGAGQATESAISGAAQAGVQTISGLANSAEQRLGQLSSDAVTGLMQAAQDAGLISPCGLTVLGTIVVGAAVITTFVAVGILTDGAGDVALVGTADEVGVDGLAGEDMDALISEAQSQYPGKAGNIELHHIIPKYLGGDPNGDTVALDAAYHQLITNSFRAEWPYGQAVPSAERLAEILSKVYSHLPLP